MEDEAIFSNTEPTPQVNDELASFVQEIEADLPEAATYITVSTATGQRRYVPTSEPMTAADVLTSAGLFSNGVVEYWLNNTRIASDTVIPVGETLVLLGSVKGG